MAVYIKDPIENIFICEIERESDIDHDHVERILIKASNIYYALIKFKTEYDVSNMTISEKTNDKILAIVTMENRDCNYSISIEKPLKVI